MYFYFLYTCRKTHSQLLEATKCDSHQLKSLVSQLGCETEAMARSAQLAMRESKAIHYQLSAHIQ